MNNLNGFTVNRIENLKNHAAKYDKSKSCTYKQRLVLRIHAVQYQRVAINFSKEA